jgi:hypothetical protein
MRSVYETVTEKFKERFHVQDPEVGGRMILKRFTEKYDLTELAQDRVKWRDFAHMEMIRRVA